MIGVALIKKCIAQNTKVTAVVRPRSKNLCRLPKNGLVKVVECDSAEIEALLNCDYDEPIDSFYHFAWDGTAREQRNNVFVQEKNIADTLLAVRTAKALQCKAFIGAGSQAEYGRVENVISPETPADPEYAYGVAKLTAGKLCEQYCKQSNLRFVWGRIFSVYGEYDHPDTLVMYLIDQLMQGKNAELTKCEQMWDYMYCADAAQAFYLLGEKGNGFYCIGSGTMRPLESYVRVICDAAGANPNQLLIGAKSYAVNQVMNLGADITKLRDDVGFEAQSDFAMGIKNTIQWYEKELRK